MGSDVICFLYKKTKEATHFYVKLINKVLHFVLQSLALAGSLCVSTVSMTPCSDPHLTIVSDSLILLFPDWSGLLGLPAAAASLRYLC